MVNIYFKIMKTLWPYYSTKKKAFYRDGKKRLVITRIARFVFMVTGDKIHKQLMWTINDINLSEAVILRSEK